MAKMNIDTSVDCLSPAGSEHREACGQPALELLGAPQLAGGVHEGFEGDGDSTEVGRRAQDLAVNGFRHAALPGTEPSGMPFVPEPAEGGRLRREREQAQSSRHPDAWTSSAERHCSRHLRQLGRQSSGMSHVVPGQAERRLDFLARPRPHNRCGPSRRSPSTHDRLHHRHAAELSRAPAKPDGARQPGRRGAHVPLLPLCRPDGRQRRRGDDRR